jgi:hypothetical protein
VSGVDKDARRRLVPKTYFFFLIFFVRALRVCGAGLHWVATDWRVGLTEGLYGERLSALHAKAPANRNVLSRCVDRIQ